MPTYDYECRACGHRFEAFQQMSEGALRKCPKCGELKLRREIGAGAGLIFRGSGFYITDYKRKESSSSGKGAGEAKKSGDKGGSGDQGGAKGKDSD